MDEGTRKPVFFKPKTQTTIDSISNNSPITKPPPPTSSTDDFFFKEIKENNNNNFKEIKESQEFNVKEQQQIPNPSLSLFPDCYKKHLYQTVSSNSPPPSSNLRYSVMDEGNCNPRFMKSTLYQVPNSDYLLKRSGLVFGLLVRPFADLDLIDIPKEVPKIEMEEGPIRCNRCRGYLNPFIQTNIKSYTCNLCGFVNELQKEIKEEEMKYGTIDYKATKEYCSKIPSPLTIIFLIDLNTPVSFIFSLIKEMTLPHLNYVIITYNKNSIHFYTENQIIYLTDIDDPFLPLPLNKISISHSKLKKQLDDIELKLPNQDLNGSCYGSALLCAKFLLENQGGRIISFTSQLPSNGKGIIKEREEKLYGTERERELFGPQDGFWKDIGDELSKNQISLDLFLFSSSNKFIESSSLSYMCLKTGGEYIHLNKGQMENLKNELKRIIQRYKVYDAVLKVRCSNGISIKGYYGNYYQQTNDDIDLPGIDSDSTFFIELKHDLEIQNQVIYFQCAILYTSQFGERLIRVHNLKLNVTNQIIQLFKFADLDAHFIAISRFSSNLIIKNRDAMDIVKRYINEKLIQILTMYRKEVSKSSNSGQLILPDSLKLLPIYLLGLIKSPAFKNGLDIAIDERISFIFNLSRISIEKLIHFSYPLLFSLINMPDKVIAFDKLEYPLPPQLNLSASKITQDGLYLLNDSKNTYLWIGKKCPKDYLDSLFNLPFDDIKSDTSLNIDHSEFSNRFMDILKELSCQKLFICKSGQMESVFYSKLIEDRVVSGTQSYVEYLCYIHKEIQNRL